MPSRAASPWPLTREAQRWIGVPRPRPGFVRGEARAALARPFGHVHFAGAETAGLPLFEEAGFPQVEQKRGPFPTLGYIRGRTAQ